MIKAVRLGGLPVVLVDRLPEDLAETLDAVVEDNYGAAYELTMQVLQHDVQSLAVIHGPLTASTAAQRAQGVQAALKEKAPDVSLTEYYGDFSFASGAQAVSRFLENGHPEAIIAMNNLMAMGDVGATQTGIQDRHRCSVRSYGAVETLMLPDTSLYYVDQNPKNLGTQVGSIVRRRLQEPDAEVVTTIMKQPVLVRRL